MLDKRARQQKKRAKHKARLGARVRVRGGDAAINEFMDIAFPDNPMPLTEDLFNKLAASGDFMTRENFETLKCEGAVYNPARQSFVFPMVSSFDDIDCD